MLAIEIVVQWKAGDDCTRGIIIRNSALGGKHVNKFDYSFGEGHNHELG